MTPRERLRQHLETLEKQIEYAELRVEEYQNQSALIFLAKANTIIKEILGATQTCSCLSHPFPHKRGSQCPESLT